MNLKVVDNQPVNRISENDNAPENAQMPTAEAAERTAPDAGRDSKIGEMQNRAGQLRFNAAIRSANSPPKDFSKEATVAKVGNQTIIDAGAGDDKIGVSQNAKTGEVTVNVNGASKTFSKADSENLVIKAGDGSDTIKIAKGVTVSLRLEGGKGNDTIIVDKNVKAAQFISGGAGDDTLTGGAGRDYIDGSTGNDVLSGGAGNDVVYGGEGNDTLDGQNGDDYLEGGKGSDNISGGAGRDILSGGLGDDTLKSGDGDDVLYAGQGKDKLYGEKGSNKIFSQTSDAIDKNGKGVLNTVIIVELKGNPGGTSVSVTGSDEFKERVEADLEMLRSSPTGRKMLEGFDSANAKDKVTVNIIEQTNYREGNYADWANRTNPTQPQPRLNPATGKTGTPNNSTIGYYPGKLESAGRERPPVVGLFHEMAHVYDFTHGTLQNGVYDGTDSADKKSAVRPDVNNLERVAVGLPINHDNDPKTVEQSDPNHPTDLTENGLRDELELPKRPSYR